MNFKKWVKNIQTAGYNGARTVNVFGIQNVCKKLMQTTDYKCAVGIIVNVCFKKIWTNHSSDTVL